MSFKLLLFLCFLSAYFLIFLPQIIYGAEWTPTGTTNVARFRFVSEKLQSGKILTIGGETQNPSPSYTNTVQEFDPITSLWTSKTPMHQRRYMHTSSAITTNDGIEKILVVGGKGGLSGYPGDYLKSAELYNPLTNTWTYTSTDIPSYHANHTSTILNDGKVLVIGGHGNFGVRTTSVDLYDPINNIWSVQTPMPQAKVYHTATLLNDGRVFVVGGQIASGSSGIHVATTEFYDPNTGTWSAGPNLNIARQAHKAILLSNGRVMVIGGTGNAGSSLSSVEVWHPATNNWSIMTPMAQPRFNHTATLLQDGRVLITGGSPFTSSVEIYNPLINTWETTLPMSVNRSLHTASLLNDGGVLVVNGLTSSGPTKTSEKFSPDSIITPTPTPNPVLDVPYFNQNDEPWGSSEYDHAQSLGFADSTMDRWGCAVTSIAMILKFHGMTEMLNGLPIDPGSVNQWLKNNNGYATGTGKDGSYSYLIWESVGKLTKDLYDSGKSQIKLMHKRAYPGTETTALLNDDLLVDKFPDVLLVQNAQTSGHFVVAKGVLDDTYSINDPEWNYSDLTSFNNSYSQVDRYLPSHTDLSYLHLIVNPDIEILVTDSLGRKTGKFAHDGIVDEFNQIPGATYNYEPPIDNAENFGTGVNSFMLSEPLSGEYTFTLSSNTTTQYTLNSILFSEDGENYIDKTQNILIPSVNNSFTVTYDKQSIEDTVVEQNISLSSLQSDLQALFEQELINNKGTYNSLRAKINLAVSISEIPLAFLSDDLTEKILSAFMHELNAQRGKHVSEDAYQVLKYDADFLLTDVQSN